MSEPEVHEWFDGTIGARFRVVPSSESLEIGWVGDDFRPLVEIHVAVVRELTSLAATVKALREENAKLRLQNTDLCHQLLASPSIPTEEEP